MSAQDSTDEVPTPPPGGGGRRRNAADIAAPVLLLVTPAVIFLSSQNYPYFSLEAGAFLGVLAGLGILLGGWFTSGGRWVGIGLIAVLATLFVDAQFNKALAGAGIYWSVVRLAGVFILAAVLAWVLSTHLATIVVAVTATALAATVLVPPEVPFPDTRTAQPGGPPNKDLPLIVHLVLDEHIGIEGIPQSIDGGGALKSSLKKFFSDKGFRVFGKAYSNFFSTHLTLANLFNGGPLRSDIVGDSDDAFRLKMDGNRLFERLGKRGYQIKVYQSDFMDFCGGRNNSTVFCYSYPCCTLKNLEDLALPFVDKAVVIAGNYLDPMISYRIVRRAYRWLVHVGLPMARWPWEELRLAPLTAFDVVERVQGDLAKASGGEYYFAHLFLPHFPYVYDGECRLRRPSAWLSRWSQEGLDRDRWGTAGNMGASKNTPPTRRLRYQRYFEQTRCLYRKLDALFESLRRSGRFADAVIIVQGDHGSRIPLDDPDSGRSQPLGDGDKVDSFSTLFAVKAPGVAPGYDLRLISLQTLFNHLVGSRFRSVPDGSFGEPPAARMLHPSGRGGDLMMTDFGQGSGMLP
jgi:hypothetical protein